MGASGRRVTAKRGTLCHRPQRLSATFLALVEMSVNTSQRVLPVSHKYVRSDTEVSNEWLVRGLKITKDKL